MKINDNVEESAGKPSTYITLERKWKAGDIIVITLPASLRIEKAKDDPSMVSIFFGPVLLAGELGRENMPSSDCADKDAYLNIPAVAVPDIVSSSTNPSNWLSPIPNEKSAFIMHDAGPADGIVFRPLYEVHHQRYSVYWRFRNSGISRISEVPATSAIESNSMSTVKILLPADTKASQTLIVTNSNYSMSPSGRSFVRITKH